MENGKKEFVGTLCNIFIILLVAVLPLYTRGSYYKLGDSKYLFFRNVSLFCLGIWLLVAVISGVGVLATRVRKTSRVEGLGFEQQRNARGAYRIPWSTVDICMISYGACALLSAFASPYGETTWIGYRDWYMGALSQILFVGIYFFVSREYTKVSYPIRAGELGLFLVVVIAFLQRFGVDILKLHKPYAITDWECSHMLSTIGNINWLCGYLCVLLPWPVVGFFYSKKIGKQIVYYIVSVPALTLALTQGSDIGILLVVACLGLGVLYGIKRPAFFKRSVLLAMGVCALCPVMGYLMKALGTWDMLAVDGFLSGQVTKPFWWILAGLLLVVYLLQSKLPDKWIGWLNRFLLIGGIIIAVGLVAIYLCGLPAGDAWGSGRGGLWRAAWMGFCEADPLRKIVGFGPDCFAEYIYRNPALEALIRMEDYWEYSVFANAHNEWLNMLVNGGLLGVAAYASVFVCGLRRYRGMMLGVMVLTLYGVNSIFSFQQVLSTPLLFLVLGICENRYRKEFL